jgi:hypothetical protein
VCVCKVTQSDNILSIGVCFVVRSHNYRKRLVASSLSVCLSLPTQQLGPPPDGFPWNLILDYFPKMHRENSGCIGNLTRITVTYVKTNIHFIISHSVLLKMKSVSEKSSRKKSNHTFCIQQYFSRTPCRVWRNVEKYGRTGQATYGSVIRRVRFACWIAKTTHTLRMCSIYCFHASKFVKRPRLNVTFIRAACPREHAACKLFISTYSKTG